MDIKEFAHQLNGREYCYDMFTEDEIKIAKDNHFVIVYGASDDLIELDGAIYDEGGCFDGGKFHICETGIIEYGNSNTKYIEAIWCDHNEVDENGEIISWTYKTNIPHETFMIYDDGLPYCRGLVFRLEDIL